jgi:hypothetical protein
MKKVTIVDLSVSRKKLTQNIYRVWNVRFNDTKVNKTPYNMTIPSRILKRFTISGHKVNIELHESLSSPVISKRSTIKKIMNILLLRQKEPLRHGGDLNPKKVPQRTKIRHKKLIIKTSLDKSNILRVITSDDHVINIKKEKSPTMRWHVDKESCIMSAGGKSSSRDHRGKTLKPRPRSLLKAIKGTMKVTNHALRNRIPRWWTHVNILTQLTNKKDILHIKLRDGPSPNRSHNKKSVNSGHMGNMSKSLIIILTMLLLKTTSNKTSLISLKRTIRESLNLIYPLTSDRTNTSGIGHKIPCASPLKGSNLLSHRVLPFRMKNNIVIRSWLRQSSSSESQRRVTVRWSTYVLTTSKKLLQRGTNRRGGRNRRRRWHLQRGRWHIRRELSGGSRKLWQTCSPTAVDLCHWRLHCVVWNHRRRLSGRYRGR